MSEENEREDKRVELELESITQAVKLFPHLDRAEARIIMIVLSALWPMLNNGNATAEHNDLKRLVDKHNTRRKEVRNNPIAEVKAYKPDKDNW